jgi:hypothetical protein
MRQLTVIARRTVSDVAARSPRWCFVRLVDWLTLRSGWPALNSLLRYSPNAYCPPLGASLNRHLRRTLHSGLGHIGTETSAPHEVGLADRGRCSNCWREVGPDTPPRHPSTPVYLVMVVKSQRWWRDCGDYRRRGGLGDRDSADTVVLRGLKRWRRGWLPQ